MGADDERSDLRCRRLKTLILRIAMEGSVFCGDD